MILCCKIQVCPLQTRSPTLFMFLASESPETVCTRCVRRVGCDASLSALYSVFSLSFLHEIRARTWSRKKAVSINDLKFSRMF